MKTYTLPFLLLSILAFSCAQITTSDNTLNKTTTPTEYWYAGEAEITSYELSQARYGEIHKGTTVTVFVTEPFSPSKNTKADGNYTDNIPALKLNVTKKFNTGIYPYSMMNSTFFPFKNGKHSLKASTSIQEWCGHTYMELKNDSNNFNIDINSYFEGESKEDILLNKAVLEDDIWSMIRVNQKALPIGEISLIPSFFYLRLKHVPTKAYKATASINKGSKTSIYSVYYPNLDRILAIEYNNTYPHVIESWRETYTGGWGKNKNKLTTTGKRIRTIKSAYWGKNTNKDSSLRKKLGLK